MHLRTVSTSLLHVTLAATLAAACETPEPTVPQPVAAAAVGAGNGDNAPIHWNAAARGLVAARGASTPFAMRGYAILSVAQYHAAVAAEKGHGAQPSSTAAIASASAVVLKYLFPADSAALDADLAAYLATVREPRGRSGTVAAGAAIGRTVATGLVQRAMNDGFATPWTGTVPTGPGMWFSSTSPPTPPAGAGFGQALPFLLRSTAQFRPAPHPAFGSSAFNAAVAEVRAFSDTRTPRQDSLAKFWHLPVGTYAPPGYWNEEATKLARRYHTDERRTALALALTNITMYDALLASHEAKYHYWLLRPSQADPAITLSVGLPNFPAYPSNHAAISAGAALVLGRLYPAERARLKALGEEAALSRIYGGIHYRFDGDAGLQLGRRVARWTLAHAPAPNQPFNLR